MRQYLTSVHHTVDGVFPEGEEMEAVSETTGRFNEKLREAGSWVLAGGLHPIDSATTLDGTANAAERTYLTRRRAQITG